MILPTDIPTHAEIDRLREYRAAWGEVSPLTMNPLPNRRDKADSSESSERRS